MRRDGLPPAHDNRSARDSDSHSDLARAASARIGRADSIRSGSSFAASTPKLARSASRDAALLSSAQVQLTSLVQDHTFHS